MYQTFKYKGDNKMAIIMTLENVKTILKKSNFKISSETRSGNDLGTVLKLENGCLINCWDKGTVNCQGKNKAIHLLVPLLKTIKYLLCTDIIKMRAHN